jgi:hypothetical protein
MRPKKTKADRIREYLAKNPNADVAKLAERFQTAKPVIYKLRKELLDKPIKFLSVQAAPVEETFTVTAPAHGEITATSTSALDVQVAGDHYRKMKIQPVEYIHANGIPFIEGCIIKYASRWRDKGGIRDLEKIKHFADLLIELETRK